MRAAVQASRCGSFTDSTAAWKPSRRLLMPSMSWKYWSLRPWLAKLRMNASSLSSLVTTAPASP